MTTEEARDMQIEGANELLKLSTWILNGQRRDTVVANRAYWQTASVEELMRFITCIPPKE